MVPFVLIRVYIIPGQDETSKAAKDLDNSEDKSHDKAYNAIISHYYTTDPFFGVGPGQQDMLKIKR